MKRIGLIVLGLCLITSIVAVAAEVRSVNTVGYVKKGILPAGKLVLVGCNFSGFSTTLEGVLGTNQLRAASLYNSADRVYLWDPAGVTYKIYAIKSSTMKFHDATSLAAWLGAATNPPVYSGDAFWIKSFATATGTNVVYVMGQVPAEGAATNTIIPGMQMVSYPFAADVGINALAFANNGAISNAFYTSSDQVLLWDEVNSTYNRFGLKASDNKWHPCPNLATWLSSPAATDVIPVGMGFWYLRRGLTSFSWVEANPYIANL